MAGFVSVSVRVPHFDYLPPSSNYIFRSERLISSVGTTDIATRLAVFARFAFLYRSRTYLYGKQHNPSLFLEKQLIALLRAQYPYTKSRRSQPFGENRQYCTGSADNCTVSNPSPLQISTVDSYPITDFNFIETTLASLAVVRQEPTGKENNRTRHSATRHISVPQPNPLTREQWLCLARVPRFADTFHSPDRRQETRDGHLNDTCSVFR